ncbi:hypothetical protein G6F46_006894 [Rhizopus delemar]|uniref:Small-subunit processome Utp12 domain-containing protein n=3 Tax=Rhizopus TaxID=4842 RepID=I1BLN1_RHIO9|nr:hypothetical protein RO3G_01815 [Rhizopus delemar RA 99-880]KAG1049342.1 hypothetical protein G6F43_008326 [Rhizopus delemar]KAG1541444.1 hypothetical protein G6F51_007892 [Rhizopus arrhizus]KAG1456439.1 hypothetical protein G6F55_006504 [Rhizopus delemar]KAG1496784.1 hypothetical protein G6F54_006229 [Rhizopus delemar]|eukprot:EIE77111.1 hypothetical protein RO3G_01815 [Rhizopus delemar RA 99-880]
MVKKGGNKSNTRSSSTVTDVKQNEDVEIINEDHSKFSVIRSSNEYNVSKEIKHWNELKQECTTIEEIHNTVRRLPLDNVLPLLEELLEKFDVQQARNTDLTEWIKAVLLIHTAYFMTMPEIVGQLSNLYNELDVRLTVYPKLLAMHGRLGLIQRQIDYRNRKEEDESEEEGEDVKVFSESEDEDLEDDAISDEGEEEDDEHDDLMDMDNNETPMFEEEEDYLNTEDEDDDLSDSDIEE